MKRSKWKGPFINVQILKNLKNKNKQIFERSSTILPQFIGSIIKIYNGKRFIKVKITNMMIGHKFGEFALTRQPFKYKKK